MYLGFRCWYNGGVGVLVNVGGLSMRSILYDDDDDAWGCGATYIRATEQGG